MTEYVLHILIMVGIYGILASSLNLLCGYTGLLSIAHAAFYGLGAYATALLTLDLGVPFLPALTIASLAASIIAAIVAVPALRVHGDSFVLATFAFQVLAFHVFNNSTSVTGGPLGLPGIPTPSVFGWELSSKVSVLVLVAACAAISQLVVLRIVTSPLGRLLRAIREDEVLVQAAGRAVGQQKVKISAIGGAGAGMAGALFAGYIGFVDPRSFTVNESILIIAMVILGGAGSRWGPILGATMLIALPEALRFVANLGPAAASMRQILYGAALVAFMLWRPQGLVGEFSFDPEA